MHRSISLLFWHGKVCSSWLLLDLADVLLLEDFVLSSCSHQVWCCRWPVRFYGRTLSHTVPAHLYRPAMQKTSQILASTKYRRLPKFHLFWPNFSSQYLCSQASYQKLVKAKSNHHHCSISVFLLMTSIQRPSQRSTAWPLSCPNGEGVPDGGRGKGGKARKRPNHIKVKGGREQTRFTSVLNPKSTLYNKLQ
jgi:hypothetical protein